MTTLKDLRKLSGMTQKQLAERSGINIRQIQKYESGECDIQNMTAATADGISKALGCSMEQLLAINVDIFTDEMYQAIKSGEMTMRDAYSMSKHEEVKRLSQIGTFGDTFYKNYERIPESLIDKLTASEIAELVDAFYECYSAGKRA